MRFTRSSHPRCDRTPAWTALQAHYQATGRSFDARQAFASDALRFSSLSQRAPYVFADLSKNRVEAATETLLLDLARQCGLEAHRAAMFDGTAINTTENREVLHVLLRKPAVAPVDTAGAATEKIATEVAKVHATLDAMLAYAEQMRADKTITDVVNIGIGGSDLGPQMAVLALDAFAASGKRLHFVSNVDGHELAATLKALKADSTLFLIASKTFTTIEIGLTL